MNSRAIHIFKKDTRHLRPQIFLFLAMLVLFACNDPTYLGYRSGLASLAGMLDLLLPLSCWLLLVSLIHEETPMGHDHYWLTRPFTWSDLLAAKALFLFAFVNLPLFVCHMAVLAVHGFSPIAHITDLLARQVFLTAALALPVIAMAAVTKNLGHAVIGIIVLWIPAMAISGAMTVLAPGSNWGGMAWMRQSIVALTGLAGAGLILYLQFKWRCTVQSRAILGAVAVLAIVLTALPPWQPAFVLQSWLSSQRVDPAAVRISFDPRNEVAVTVPDVRNTQLNTERLEIPIQIAGTPAGTKVVADWIRVEAEGGGVKPWHSGWEANWQIRQDAGGKGWLTMMMEGEEFDRIQNVPVHLHATADLTLFAQTAVHTDPLLLEDFWGYGSCRSNAGMRCLSPRPTAAITVYSGTKLGQTQNGPLDLYGPYSTSPWFGPLQAVTVPELYDPSLGVTGYIVVAEHPVSHIQRSLDFQNIRLADYVVR
jgi:hypothetical protein